MPELATVPAFRLLLCCLLGYLIAIYCGDTGNELFFTAFSIAILFGSFLFIYDPRKYTYSLNIILLTLLILLFFWRYTCFSNDQNTTSKLYEEAHPLPLVFLESYKKTNGYNYLFSIDHPNIGHMKLLFFHKEKLPFRCGDQIIYSGQLKPPRKIVFKDQLNFDEFLKRKGIRHGGYFDQSQFTPIGSSIGLKELPIFCRSKLLQSLKRNIKTDESRAIAESLILGYKYNLSKTTKQKFAENSTMHILAVSGMHLGILAGLLLLLLNRVFPYRKQKILVVLFTIFLLFSYCAIVGFPPSAVRATLMISLFLLGKYSMRGQSNYNILFFTALVMLIYDPGLIGDIGFQLSFMAVLSILFFYPLINSIIQFNNSILKFLWSLISVGIAAQIGTLGLSIFYFNLFSPWFWLTGIPSGLVATFSMISGMLLFLFDLFSPLIASYIGAILDITLSLFSQLLDRCYALSWHHFDKIYWTLQGLILYYIAIVYFSIYCTKRSIYALNFSLFCLLGCFSYQVFYQIKNPRTVTICELNIGGEKVVEVHYDHLAVTINAEKISDNQLSYYLNYKRIENQIMQHVHLQESSALKVSDIKIEKDKIWFANERQFSYIKGTKEKTILAKKLKVKNPII